MYYYEILRRNQGGFDLSNPRNSTCIDTIFVGEDIITLDDVNPTAEALAARDGKITAVCGRGEVLRKKVRKPIGKKIGSDPDTRHLLPECAHEPHAFIWRDHGWLQVDAARVGRIHPLWSADFRAFHFRQPGPHPAPQSSLRRGWSTNGAR